MSDRQKVYVIDYDAAVRRSLHDLLSAAGFFVKTFANTADFLGDKTRKDGCLIVDVHTPNWLEFRIELARQNHDLVILIISSHADMPMVIGALRTVAIDFIEKPFDSEQIIASVRRALDIRASVHDRAAETETAKQKLALLTARELSVAQELITGKSNKQAASKLKISPRTIELHRANIMKKLEITSISQLVRLMLVAAAANANGNGEQGDGAGRPGARLTLISGGKATD